jgi:signal transduction histidine kinase
LRAEELNVLAEEHAALRRVATLVARGTPPDAVFAAIVEEVVQLLPVEYAHLGRYEPGRAITFVATWSRSAGGFSVGSRWNLGGKNLATIVFETGRPARIDGYADASGPIGLAARERDVRSAVGTAIIVEGRLWGVMIAGSTLGQPLPADTEARLADFTGLLATAIANAENRTELARLAQEQAALRRVATVVARGAPRDRVFGAVVEELVQLLPVDLASMGRYESDGTITFVASWSASGDPFVAVAGPVILGGKNLGTIVFETGRPARIDSCADASGPLDVTARKTGFCSAVATPIIVETLVWGVLIAGSALGQPLPADTEARLASFTELLATATANAESRTEVARLAEEQAALRRVATLVARGASPDAVFAAVVEEVVKLLPVDYAHMGRYQSDGALTIVTSLSRTGPFFPVGSRWVLGGNNLATLVYGTGRPARVDGYADGSGPIGVAIRERGRRSAVGTPIIVEGRLWGVMIAGSTLEQPLPADTEARLASFTELLATAIANAESGAALAASRARIVAAADETRRRIERDLHDGAQQRLVSLGLQLRAAQAMVPPRLGELERELSDVAEGLASVFDELREISHGIHPAILSERGLQPALRALTRRSAVPVELDLHPQRRLPQQLEVAAYYVVSEALTNAAKHAHASVVHVELDAHDEIFQLEIHDDGIGGADPGHGSGLVGLSDRIEALGGTLEVTSPTGSGTTLLIEIPLEDQSSAGSPEA